MHCAAIGDIEIGVIQRHHVMLAGQSPGKMTAHESRRAGNQNFHKARV